MRGQKLRIKRKLARVQGRLLLAAMTSPNVWSLGDGHPVRPCLDPPLIINIYQQQSTSVTDRGLGFTTDSQSQTVHKSRTSCIA